MSYQLPHIDTSIPPSLSAAQYDALHALVLHLCGLRLQKAIFRKAKLKDNDIRSYKQGRVRFDASDSRLQEIHRTVYERFRDVELKDDADGLHAAIIPLLDLVYAGNGNGTRDPTQQQDAAAASLYAIHNVSDDSVRDVADVVVGAYDLYRRGDVEGDTPELAQCALLIMLRQVQRHPRLFFELSYERRHNNLMDEKERSVVEGVVVDHGTYIALHGVDHGSFNSPTLIILNISARRRPDATAAYDGVLLRRSTSSRTVAARCIAIRRPSKDVKAEYAKATDEARIMAHDADALPGKARHSFDVISRYVDNHIDNMRRWVLLDRGGVSSPHKGIRSSRPPASPDGWKQIVLPPTERDTLLNPHDRDLRTGYYLNIRTSHDKQFRLSFMAITPSAHPNCFEFQTDRTVVTRGVEQGIRQGAGLVYKVSGKWIANGIVLTGAAEGAAGMPRLSIMFDRQREGKSMGDMFGIRLTAAIDDSISAHKIYCYKLLHDPDQIDDIRDKLSTPKYALVSREDLEDLLPEAFAQVRQDLIGNNDQLLTALKDSLDGIKPDIRS